MKTRIITAAILVPILLLVVLVAPKSVAAVVLGVLLAIGAYELLYRTKLIQRPRMVIASAAMAFAVSIWSYFSSVHAYFILMMMAFFMIMYAEMMLDHVKVQLDMVGMCFMAGLIIPYLLSSLIRILMLNIGRYVILIPFVVAFLSDTGAYFVGTKYGKHKLSPVVSPNKTIEGLLGGLVFASVGMLVYAFILDLPLHLVGTFGDLCFSVVKRQTGIKDYGNLIPGHGGVLDRLDSMTLVAPLMEAFLLTIPMVAV